MNTITPLRIVLRAPYNSPVVLNTVKKCALTSFQTSPKISEITIPCHVMKLMVGFKESISDK